MQRIKKDFYWPGQKSDVKKFIRGCDMCQRVKVPNTHPSGLSQLLSIPSQPWAHITMYFVEDLLNSKGFSSLWVVVDRLTKYSQFYPLNHPYSSKDVAELFLKNILKRHELPQSIASDIDNTFTINFWRELFILQGV